jgi:hypothetical protein
VIPDPTLVKEGISSQRSTPFDTAVTHCTRRLSTVALKLLDDARIWSNSPERVENPSFHM